MKLKNLLNWIKLILIIYAVLAFLMLSYIVINKIYIYEKKQEIEKRYGYLIGNIKILQVAGKIDNIKKQYEKNIYKPIYSKKAALTRFKRLKRRYKYLNSWYYWKKYYKR